MMVSFPPIYIYIYWDYEEHFFFTKMQIEEWLSNVSIKLLNTLPRIFILTFFAFPLVQL